MVRLQKAVETRLSSHAVAAVPRGAVIFAATARHPRFSPSSSCLVIVVVVVRHPLLRREGDHPGRGDGERQDAVRRDGAELLEAVEGVHDDPPSFQREEAVQLLAPGLVGAN